MFDGKVRGDTNQYYRDFVHAMQGIGYAGYMSYEAPNPTAWERDPSTVAREALEATRKQLS